MRNKSSIGYSMLKIIIFTIFGLSSVRSCYDAAVISCVTDIGKTLGLPENQLNGLSLFSRLNPTSDGQQELMCNVLKEYDYTSLSNCISAAGCSDTSIISGTGPGLPSLTWQSLIDFLQGLCKPGCAHFASKNTELQQCGDLIIEMGMNLNCRGLGKVLKCYRETTGSCVIIDAIIEKSLTTTGLLDFAENCEKPQFKQAPKKSLAKEGNTVTFQGQASGDPAPTILWRKDNDRMPEGRTQVLSDKSLQIENVRVADSVGYEEAAAKLTVHSPPSFLVTPRDKTVGVGRRVSFRCEVVGNPSPTVFWNKENDQVLWFPRQDNGRFTVMDDGTLVIEPIRMEDEGHYICQGLNLAGSAFSKAHLEVKDVDPRPPPIIYQGPQNQTLPTSSIAMLPCSSSGDPQPVISWSSNNRLLNMNDPRITQLASGTLQISDLKSSDAGLYTCQATSETGETIWSAALMVEAPTNPEVIFHRTPEPSTFPGAPSKPQINNIGENVITLSWKANSNHGASPVFAYTVEYFSHQTGEGWIVASDNIREQTYTVMNLQSSTSYLFLVRAQNSHGLSLPSRVTDPITTKEKTDEDWYKKIKKEANLFYIPARFLNKSSKLQRLLKAIKSN